MNEKHKCGWANLRLCEKRYGMKSALYTGVICKHSNSLHPRMLGAKSGWNLPSGSEKDWKFVFFIWDY